MKKFLVVLPLSLYALNPKVSETFSNVSRAVYKAAADIKMGPQLTNNIVQLKGINDQVGAALADALDNPALAHRKEMIQQFTNEYNTLKVKLDLLKDGGRIDKDVTEAFVSFSTRLSQSLQLGELEPTKKKWHENGDKNVKIDGQLVPMQVAIKNLAHVFLEAKHDYQRLELCQRNIKDALNQIEANRSDIMLKDTVLQEKLFAVEKNLKGLLSTLESEVAKGAANQDNIKSQSEKLKSSLTQLDSTLNGRRNMSLIGKGLFWTIIVALGFTIVQLTRTPEDTEQDPTEVAAIEAAVGNAVMTTNNNNGNDKELIINVATSAAFLFGLAIAFFFTARGMSSFSHRYLDLIRGTKDLDVGKVFGAGDVEMSSNVRLDDIGGYDGVKQELRQIISVLKNPDSMKDIGGTPQSGVLLTGPPGTGKTLFAKAIAGEAGCPTISVSAAELIKPYHGQSREAMEAIFAKARKISIEQNLPVIIFMDEIDAIGKERSNGNDKQRELVEECLNQFLVEMDGMNAMNSKARIYLVAATNRPHMLDPALIRAGRIDLKVEIGTPDVVARTDIFNKLIKKMAMDTTLDLKNLASNLAAISEGMTGAGISNALNKAAYIAKAAGRSVIGKDDIIVAIKREVSPEILNLTDIEKKKYAKFEAARTVVAKYFNSSDQPQTLIVGTNPRIDNGIHGSMTLNDFKNRIMLYFASSALTDYKQTDISSGKDKREAEKWIQYLKSSSGLLEDGDSISEMRKQMMEDVKNLLSANKDLVDEITEQLLKDELLTAEGVDAIITRKGLVKLPVTSAPVPAAA